MDGNEARRLAQSLGVAVLIIWVAMTLVFWAAPFAGDEPQTLVQVLHGQVLFVNDLLHRIW